MELYQLRYFQLVAQQGNITKASEQLHVSQPALSRSIKRLEDELGIELFDRVGRRISLNDNGRVFLKAVTHALDSVDSVGHVLERYVREKSQTLNLRAPVFFGDDPGMLARFKRLHPEITIRFASEATPYLETEVPDLTFFASFARHEEPNCLVLGEEEIVLSVPKGHALDGARSVSLADLADERFITVLPSAIRKMIDGMFAEAGYEPNIVFEDQHCFFVNQLVSEGVGLALAPEITWFSKADRERVSTVRLSDVKRSRTLYLKWQEDVEMSSAAQLFRDYIVDYYADLCASLR